MQLAVLVEVVSFPQNLEVGRTIDLAGGMFVFADLGVNTSFP